MAALRIAATGPGFADRVGLGLVLGGLGRPVCSRGAACENDRLDPGDFVRAGGAALVALCLGTTVGTTAAATTMSAHGDSGLDVFLAAIPLAAILIAVAAAGAIGSNRGIKHLEGSPAGLPARLSALPPKSFVHDPARVVWWQPGQHQCDRVPG